MDLKDGVRARTGFQWLMIESSCGSYEQDNEPSGSVKGRKFLDWLTL
jgi:hypothetical protein